MTLSIVVNVIKDPKHGSTIAFDFSEKIRSFGLDDKKAEELALHILSKVKEIRDAATKES